MPRLSGSARTASTRGWTRPARRHLLGAVDVPHRPRADRPRHRRQRLVLPRPRRGLPLAPAQQARPGREGVGDGAARQARLHAPRTSAGGTRWARPPTSPSRRARSTTPTAASRPTATPTRPSCTTDLTGPLGEFPLFKYWGPTASIKSSRWIAQAARLLLDDEHSTCCWSTCRTSTTTTSASAPRAPESAQRRARARRRRRRPGRARRGRGDQVVVLSEYGITAARRPVDDQPRPAPRRAAERLHAGGHGVPRPVDLARLRGGRPPDRPRLRPGSGRHRGGARGARRAPRRRPSAGGRALAAPPAWTTSAPASSSPSPSATPGSPTTTGSTTSARRTSPAGRDPPQARLRPRRAVHGPRRPARQGARRRGARAQEDRLALRHERRAAGSVAGTRAPMAACPRTTRTARCCCAPTRHSRATGSRRPTCATCSWSSPACRPRAWAAGAADRGRSGAQPTRTETARDVPAANG